MIARFLTVLAMFFVVACSPSLMGWPELTSRALPSPDVTLTYGEHDAAKVDLWLPEGGGPHPVVFMVHGGCWQKAIADRTLMNYAAADLRARGLAVWNIEYRGTDEEGGGYPGTFNDVADAGLLLLTEGEELGLDPSRIAGFGHSAGGHLIAWLALRHRIEGQGPLATDEPFPLRGAVLSGHLADLEEAEPVTLADCLASVRETLTGPPDELRSDPYADTSPGRLLPADLPLFSVHGREDQIAPGSLATSFSTRAGALAHSVIVPETGHVELIAPGSAAWDVQAALLAALLAPEPGSAVVLDKTAKRRQLP